MTQQFKTFHFWMMMAMTIAGAVVAGGGLTGAALKWFVLAQTVLQAINQQLAARWVPAAKTEEPSAKVIPIKEDK